MFIANVPVHPLDLTESSWRIGAGISGYPAMIGRHDAHHVDAISFIWKNSRSPTDRWPDHRSTDARRPTRYRALPIHQTG